MLRIVPPLRSYAQPLTDAMVEFYSMSQVGLTIKSVSLLGSILDFLLAIKTFLIHRLVCVDLS